jgi:hypothetical protein
MRPARQAESWDDEDFEGLAAGHGPVAVGHAVQPGGAVEDPAGFHVAENPRPAPAVLYATFVLPPKAGPEVSAPIPAPCR